jgi:hypothetical protein
MEENNPSCGSEFGSAGASAFAEASSGGGSATARLPAAAINTMPIAEIFEALLRPRCEVLKCSP